MKRRKGILPVFIALIVAGSLGMIGGGYTGARYYQSSKYEKKAQQSFDSGNYSDALDYYNKSLSFWKRKKVEDKKAITEKENNLLTTLNEGMDASKQSKWQECVDKLKTVSSDSRSYSRAQTLINECQAKIDEEAAKKKVEEEAAQKAAQGSKKKTVASPSSTASTSPSNPPPAEDPTKCRSNASPVFANQLIDPNSVTNIIPPPNVAQPSGHLKTHSYIDTTSANIPLYAPADMVLFKGDYYTGGPYYFDFRVSCEVTLRVAHVIEPISKIKEAFGSDPNAAGEIEISPPIALKAGELFAYSGGPPYVLNNGLDFGVYNSTKPNRYAGSQTSSIYTTAVCPYDYFSGSLQAAYKAKFNLVQHQGMAKDGDSFCQ